MFCPSNSALLLPQGPKGLGRPLACTTQAEGLCKLALPAWWVHLWWTPASSDKLMTEGVCGANSRGKRLRLFPAGQRALRALCPVVQALRACRRRASRPFCAPSWASSAWPVLTQVHMIGGSRRSEAPDWDTNHMPQGHVEWGGFIPRMRHVPVYMRGEAPHVEDFSPPVPGG